jgi:glycosyltransferase involved in cell wall biosynthesis
LKTPDSNKPEISVVIPVYRAEKMIDELVTAILAEISKISPNCEIILVDDRSPDNSWGRVQAICQKNPKVKGIKLSRNFGQHNAIISGISYSTGEWVVVMDCDFQDDPSFIPKLYNEAIKGYEIVFAKRGGRTDGLMKRITSKIFYKIFAFLTDIDFDGSVGNFGIYNRKVIEAILSMKESFKIFSLMALWVGFKTTYLETKHGNRKEGKSSYSYSKLINLAFNICLSYSQKLLIYTIRLGLTITVLSILFAGYNIVRHMLGRVTVLGYSSLIASIWLMGGFIILILGVIGLYLGKAFDGIKNRPVFIVDQSCNL